MVVERVADAEVAEDLVGGSINSELLVAENEVHLIVEDGLLAHHRTVDATLGQRDQPAAPLLAALGREGCIGNAGDVVALHGIEEKHDGTVAVDRQVQVAREGLLVAEQQLCALYGQTHLLLQNVSQVDLVVIELVQDIA